MLIDYQIPPQLFNFLFNYLNKPRHCLMGSNHTDKQAKLGSKIFMNAIYIQPNIYKLVNANYHYILNKTQTFDFFIILM